MDREAPYYGPRWSWTAIAMLFAPIVLFVYDVRRRFQTPCVEPAPEQIAPVRLISAPKCVCTGSGDPLCSEIPGQTCSP